MKAGRKLAAAGLALALTLALAACGGGYTAADATALVKANLDILYLGQYDADYLSPRRPARTTRKSSTRIIWRGRPDA